jgi:hypothetical protein
MLPQRRNVVKGQWCRKVIDAKKDAARVAYLAITQKEAAEQKKKDEIQKDWKKNSSCLNIDAFVPEIYNNNNDDDGDVPTEKMKNIEITDVDEQKTIEKGIHSYIYVFLNNK